MVFLGCVEYLIFDEWSETSSMLRTGKGIYEFIKKFIEGT